MKSNEINQKMSKKVSINIIENVCKDLEKAELGKRTSQPNTNGPPTKYFKKCFINELNITLINFIQKLSLDIEQLKIVNSSFKNGN